MVHRNSDLRGQRFLKSGDEAGTAPGDRPFRPDVEGLRAVAVLLVVLFHAGIGRVSGGYIGVDVFFVISGFVITGVLLRERSTTGGTSILAFYGRRCRRIIPAATLTIVATVLLAYAILGTASGAQTADDGRWAAVFLANFHFIAVGTSYLGAQLPPSPLQNLWSLSVEEQFYLVYPTLFVLIASMRMRLSLRMRLTLTLGAIVILSYAFSITDTATNPAGAYFSPFTRAWELALGALVAVATPWLLRLPSRVAALATWAGLGAILVSSIVFTSQTAYPGAGVAVPVVGAAMVIGGGTRPTRRGAEVILGLAPSRWLGRISYSLYLWHWPILILAAERAGKTDIAFPQSVPWVLVALAISVVSYVAVENPVRHAKRLITVRFASVGLGAVLVVTALLASEVASDVNRNNGGSAVDASNSSRGPSGRTDTPVASGQLVPAASITAVRALVAESARIQTVPSGLEPPIAQVEAAAGSTIGLPSPSSGCWPGDTQSTVPACVFGDRGGARTMVLYGDSHAGMWFRALDLIAQAARWRLIVLTKGSCPAAPLPTAHPIEGVGPWPACTAWHRYAVRRIDQIVPDLLVVSQSPTARMPNRSLYPPDQWGRGLRQLLTEVKARRTFVLGNLPLTPGATCIAQHEDDVQRCSGSIRSFYSPWNVAESVAAQASGAEYVDVTPWFCAKTCSSIIGNFNVYGVGNHVTTAYSLYLDGVLADALHVTTSIPVTGRH